MVIFNLLKINNMKGHGFWFWICVIVFVFLIGISINSRLSRIEARLADSSPQNFFFSSTSQTNTTFVIDKVEGDGHVFGDNNKIFSKENV